MYGSIIGDFIGSLYKYKEFLDSSKQIINKERRKDSSLEKELFKDNCFFGIDTVFIMVVLDSIINKRSYEETLEKHKENIKFFSKPEIFGSVDTGLYMIISPIAYLYDNLDKMKEEVQKCVMTFINNNEETITGAKAIACAIYMARKRKTKEEIKNYIESNFDYDLNFDLEELHNNYLFSALPTNIIPQCIYLFLISTDYEDLIRKALYIGGNTSTIAGISGSIGEAYYKINENWIIKAKSKLPQEFISLLDKAY